MKQGARGAFKVRYLCRRVPRQVVPKNRNQAQLSTRLIPTLYTMGFIPLRAESEKLKTIPPAHTPMCRRFRETRCEVISWRVRCLIVFLADGGEACALHVNGANRPTVGTIFKKRLQVETQDVHHLPLPGWETLTVNRVEACRNRHSDFIAHPFPPDGPFGKKVPRDVTNQVKGPKILTSAAGFKQLVRNSSYRATLKISSCAEHYGVRIVCLRRVVFINITFFGGRKKKLLIVCLNFFRDKRTFFLLHPEGSGLPTKCDTTFDNEKKKSWLAVVFPITLLALSAQTCVGKKERGYRKSRNSRCVGPGFSNNNLRRARATDALLFSVFLILPSELAGWLVAWVLCD